MKITGIQYLLNDRWFTLLIQRPRVMMYSSSSSGRSRTPAPLMTILNNDQRRKRVMTCCMTVCRDLSSDHVSIGIWVSDSESFWAIV